MTPESLQVIAKVFEEEMELEASGTANPDRSRILELQQYRKDGSTVWMENHLSFLRDEAQKAVGIISLSRDITERMLAEKVLRESEERYRALFDHSLDLVYITDFEGRFIDANDAALNRLGYNREEIRSLNFATLLSEDQMPIALQSTQEIMDTGYQKNLIELRLKAKNGNDLFVETVGSVILHEGIPFAVQGIARDITKRKQVEAVQLESEERYRVLFEGSTPGILITDIGTGRFVDANLSICRMLGYSKAELLQLGIADIHPKHIQDDVVSHLESQVRNGHSSIGSIPCLRKDGTVFYADIAGASTTFHGRRCAVGFFMDITERMLAEGTLQKAKDLLFQAEKLSAMGQLSAGVAHEILNPVNIISMELQMLQTMGNLPTDVLEELKVCMSQIDRIVAIAEDLKQVARIPEKRMGMANINKLIAHVLTLHTSQLMIDEIETKVHYQPDLPDNLMDKKKIEQVILNLISNARDTMEGKENKILRITTDLDEGHDQLKIMVADTGGGIKDEHILKIFDPFFTTKEEGKGTGLGLSISYGIVKDHGGIIWAENNEWGGASFYISLPVKTNMDENCK